MPSWLPRVQYPPPDQPGFWQPETSTLNWCEEDYYATVYAAEIVNTVTNFLFMGLAAKGIRNCLRYGHDSIFVLAFTGYLLVGLGSFLFHATLKYPMQLVDELSMIYTTCLMVYASFGHSRPTNVKIWLAVFLVALCLFITLYYHYLQDPAFHQNAYTILTVIVLGRGMWIMESTLRPAFRRNDELNIQSESKYLPTKKDVEIIKDMWILVAFGMSIFLTGYAIWALDNVYCSTLRSWRREMGLPWGLLLEGHGWWHLMTGLGAYMYIVWGILLRHCVDQRQNDFQLNWPSFFSIPEIVPVDAARRNGSLANGSSKKLS